MLAVASLIGNEQKTPLQEVGEETKDRFPCRSQPGVEREADQWIRTKEASILFGASRGALRVVEAS